VEVDLGKWMESTVSGGRPLTRDCQAHSPFVEEELIEGLNKSLVLYRITLLTCKKLTI